MFARVASSFKSTKVEPVGGNEYKVTGDLSLHGVTKPVVFNAEFNGTDKDPWGNLRAGLSATAKINRKDFGLNWSQTLESGGLLVGDEVKIEIDLSTIQQQVAVS